VAENLSDLQTQLEELRAVRASGEQRVQFRDRDVWFKSDKELAAAIADLERRVRALSAPPIHTVIIRSSKGL
jgi:DNA-binding GntR family transcriptional regulator